MEPTLNTANRFRKKLFEVTLSKNAMLAFVSCLVFPQ
jgi:hypothetical protein